MLDSPSMETLGLRELKKLRTRQTIIDVATRLFEAQGFHETTLVQIAAAAEIAPSTLFSYFPTKPDIVFSLMDSIIESARSRVVGRPADEQASDAIVAWLLEDLPLVEEPYAPLIRRSLKIQASVPELVAEERLRYALLEDTLADAFARDLGESAGGMRARVLAAIAVGGMIDVWSAWYAAHAGDAVLDVLETPGLKADYLRDALEAGLKMIDLLPRPVSEVAPAALSV